MNEDNTPRADTNIALYQQATNVAGLCKEIVVKKAVQISGRKYVPVEAWTTIATAHGCMASIRTVESIPSVGVRAVAEIIRMSDQRVLCSAEGFVGVDEPTWYGGTVTRYNKFRNKEETVTLPKRAEYAIRAMAQTRAMSRACRTAFGHVVTLMDAGLQTTPAEEMGGGEEDWVPSEVDGKPEPDKSEKKTPPATWEANEKATPPVQEDAAKKGPGPQKPIEVTRDPHLAHLDQYRDGRWQDVMIHFGNYKGVRLGDLDANVLRGWFKWEPQPFKGKISEDDNKLRAALAVAEEETKK